MRRGIVSQIIFLMFMILVGTGVWMFVAPYNAAVSGLHVVSSLVFSLVILFHVANNIKPLKSYVKGRKYSRFHIKPVTMLLFIAGLGLVAAAAFDLPPVRSMHQLSKELKGNEIYFKVLETNPTVVGGSEISVEVLLDSVSHTPSYAIWVEDAQGNHVEDLYVSHKVAKAKFFGSDDIRRPESLPVWSHSRGVVAEDGYYIPDSKSQVADGLSGATPSTNWILNSKIKAETDSIRILMEINQSYDWNAYYHPNAYPNDPTYSGSGMVGQPALIYATGLLSLESPQSFYAMGIKGHAHHSGKNGNIYRNMDSITTALKMVKRIMVHTTSPTSQ